MHNHHNFGFKYVTKFIFFGRDFKLRSRVFVLYTWYVKPQKGPLRDSRILYPCLYVSVFNVDSTIQPTTFRMDALQSVPSIKKCHPTWVYSILYIYSSTLEDKSTRHLIQQYTLQVVSCIPDLYTEPSMPLCKDKDKDKFSSFKPFLYLHYTCTSVKRSLPLNVIEINHNFIVEFPKMTYLCCVNLETWFDL